MAKRYTIIILAAFMLLANNAILAHNHRDTLGTGSRIHFVQNLGQWNSNVLFSSQMRNSALFVEQQCFTIVVRGEAPKEAPFHHSRGHKLHAYRINFAGSSPNATISGDGIGTSFDNYYIGNNPEKWKSHVPNYSNVTYSNIYPNINLHVYSAEHALKYDFEVLPGANPNDIALHYNGDVVFI